RRRRARRARSGSGRSFRSCRGPRYSPVTGFSKWKGGSNVAGHVSYSTDGGASGGSVSETYFAPFASSFRAQPPSYGTTKLWNQWSFAIFHTPSSFTYSFSYGPSPQNAPSPRRPSIESPRQRAFAVRPSSAIVTTGIS